MCEKSYTKCDGDTIPRLFSKKSKLSISRDQYCKASYSLFYVMPSWRLSEHTEIISWEQGEFLIWNKSLSNKVTFFDGESLTLKTLNNYGQQ